MRKTREEAQETREKILSSALDIMSERSFSRVSVSDIAERVGLSKGAVYWHFKNKEDILVHLVEDFRCEGEVGLRNRGCRDVEGMKRYFREVLTMASRDERFKKFNMLFQRRFEWPEEVRAAITRILIDNAERERAMLDSFLSKLQGAGKVRRDVDASDIAALVNAVFHGLFMTQLSGLYPIDFSKYVDFVFDAFAKELAPTREEMATTYKEEGEI